MNTQAYVPTGAKADGHGGDRAEVADEPPAWLVAFERATGCKAPAPPKMTTRDRFDTDRGSVYGLSFDRPVHRDEALRQIYTDGKRPVHPTEREHNENSVILRSRDGKEPSSEWELYVPTTPKQWPWKTIEPGVLDALHDPRVPARLPAWIPETSARLIESKQLPPPAGTPGLDVKQHGSVTTWRDGDTVFRYDTKRGELEGFRLQNRPYTEALDHAMLGYVHGEGKTLRETDAQIEREFRHLNWSFIEGFTERYVP